MEGVFGLQALGGDSAPSWDRATRDKITIFIISVIWGSIWKAPRESIRPEIPSTKSGAPRLTRLPSRKTSFRATGPGFRVGSWTEPSQMLRGIKASGERPEGAQGRQTCVLSTVGCKSLPDWSWTPTRGAGGTSVGDPCLVHSSWWQLPGATPGQVSGSSRPGAFKDLRIQGLRHETV